ncbi:two-component system response regulator YesN [Paenibacillus cellulosilyticus]|uniref:Two-component system response regulator YesN n=1 Tax=Paenibacillus cellulosilyticus TaxID=375489 RepID=A0A2V2YZ21_9BACL|nr:response regulator [Paenibacillus cellulosilyticus]PWW07182.1 two-component system response regulator YesN [Paenibacillus cellulosilyticus]QKS44615.1 response regulator [Paenibacillus cellulosilyticus]
MYKVVLADDEPLALEGMELLANWEKRGFQVDRMCLNGEEAIEHIRHQPPDLVITDIRMPILNGFELIEETRRLGNHTTLFVITSGYDDFDYAKRAMRLGVKEYLTKPVVGPEIDEMLERMHKELRERERRVFIRESADRYTIRQGLSALLFGGEEDEKQAAVRRLAQLTVRDAYWTYIHVGTDAESARGAREAALGLAGRTNRCYLIDSFRDSFGIVVGLNKSEDIVTRSFAEQLLSAMQNATSGRIEMAVGCIVDSLDDLSKCYSSAVEAERFLFFGDTAIVHYEDIRGKTLSFDPGVLKMADVIVDVMENGSADDLTGAIREAFCNFEERMTLPELVGIFVTQVVLQCVSVCRTLGGDHDELLKQTGLLTAGELIGNRQQLTTALTSFCLNCQSIVFDLRAKQNSGTIAKVSDFLRHHFKTTFTIKELSERFYINPVYLGQSFSRKYGKGILEFIHDLRIEEAARLLRETEGAMWTIAEELGYCGYQHFLKQFEKRLGMKPSDYRLQFQK